MTQDLARITGYEANVAMGCVEYKIEVATKGFTAKRRFREFLQLHEDLLPVLHEEAPKLPSRIFRTSPEERLPVLNKFLQSMCESLANNPPKPLLRFLNVDLAGFAAARAVAFPHSASQIEVVVGTPKVPEKFKAEIERVITEVLESVKAQDGVDGWKKVGSQAPWTWMARAEDPKMGIKSNRIIFGELKRCPPRLVHELMLDNEACKKMEPKMDIIQDMEKLDEQTIVQYFIMKSIMFLPPRDVILVRHWRVLPDQKIVHAEFSIEEYPGVPSAESKGRVRAKLTVGGCVIEPVQGDPTACKVWRVNDMDPRLGDAIPAYAMEKLNEFTAAMLSNNMFSLGKLVAASDMQAVLRQGPLVNWNGSVKGNLADQAIMKGKSQDVQGSSKLDPIIIIPIAASFFMGFAAATMGFLAVKQ